MRRIAKWIAEVLAHPDDAAVLGARPRRRPRAVPAVPGSFGRVKAAMAGRGTFTFLGTGTSVGVPMIGCDCAVCTSTEPAEPPLPLVRSCSRRGRDKSSSTPARNCGCNCSASTACACHAVVFTRTTTPITCSASTTCGCSRHAERRRCRSTAPTRSKTVIRQAFAYAFHPADDELPAGSLPQARIPAASTERAVRGARRARSRRSR